MICPICKEETRYTHAPDGRCDNCAEEYGCSCSCFPPVALQILSDHDAGSRRFERDEDRWKVTFKSLIGEEIVTVISY